MRYIIDERTGCAAILDTEHEFFKQRKEGNHNGLHSDDPDIVSYVTHENTATHKGYPVRYFSQMAKLYGEMSKLVSDEASLLFKSDREGIKDDKPVDQSKQYKYERVECNAIDFWQVAKEYQENYGNTFNSKEERISCLESLVEMFKDNSVYRRIELTPEEVREQEIKELVHEFDKISTKHYGTVDLTMQECNINRAQARYILDNFNRKG